MTIKNLLFFDNVKNINKLDELKEIFEADKIEIIAEEEQYNIFYYKNKGLFCNGCRIKLIYPDSCERIKLGGEIIWQK